MVLQVYEVLQWYFVVSWCLTLFLKGCYGVRIAFNGFCDLIWCSGFHNSI